MNIIFFAHPTFLGSQSMPRFAQMLAEGMRERAHQVTIWMPQPLLYSLFKNKGLQKWLGYIDQYIMFPAQVRLRLRRCPADTLFVFTDQALGPWVPLVKKRPHVIHCHDFLAQRSALGEVPENLTGWTGRQYQAFIRWGYTKGKHFISVSQTTRNDLHRFLLAKPVRSEIVYNGLNQDFIQTIIAEARRELTHITKLNLLSGYLLHVGGNQWYKNRLGIIELYDAWRKASSIKLPLLLIGEEPTEQLIKLRNHSAFKTDIHFLVGIQDKVVRLAYAGALVFLFPSLAEGFGWPIAEAMASGCLVVTTQEAPMTEVGGNAAFYIPRRPITNTADWAIAGAQIIKQVVELGPIERKMAVEAGLTNASRFESTAALNQIETIYQNILQTTENA
jgi:glycosyltransferase involved in cell wall biosynthesis